MNPRQALCAARDAAKIPQLIRKENTMAEEKLTLEAVKKLAADVGMTRLTDAHLQELTRATEFAHARRKTLATATLTYVDEPAHILDLTRGETK